MKFCINFLKLFAFVFPIIANGQNFEGRLVLGEKHAKLEIQNSAKANKEKAFYDTLIADKETAIAVVEPILFKIYGKDNIISERPYESYLIDGYWYIAGTLPRGSLGGTFEIIINSKNGKIIKLIHGK